MCDELKSNSTVEPFDDRMDLRIYKTQKEMFIKLCDLEGKDPSVVIRSMISTYCSINEYKFKEQRKEKSE